MYYFDRLGYGVNELTLQQWGGKYYTEPDG